MGKKKILTSKQKLILNEIVNDDFIVSQFYFTGGTALSEFYLQHRLSIDLDFFSFKKFDSLALMNRLRQWSKAYQFEFSSKFVDPTYIYVLKFKDNQELKIDFGHFPHRQLEKPLIFQRQLRVDSLLDLAVNKLLSVIQRTEAKDFVDLYFLLKKFTFWDLRQGVRVKFGVKIEPYLVATDFLKVEDFEYLPKMLKPLKLEDLKTFFRKKAIELGKKAVE